MADHDHSHCHPEGGGSGHDHSHDDDIIPALQSSLYKHIDFDKITTLNEAVSGSGKRIVQKPWEDRLDSTHVLTSDVDEQMLMFIPFTGSIKLHSVLLLSPPTPSAPRVLKLYANRDDLDFTCISDTPATQTLTIPLIPGSGSASREVLEIPVKRPLFGNVGSLTLFFESNHAEGNEDEDGEEVMTEVQYLGFKGDWRELRKEAVVALYEAAANPADHKNLVPGGGFGMGSDLGHGY